MWVEAERKAEGLSFGDRLRLFPPPFLFFKLSLYNIADSHVYQKQEANMFLPD